MTRRAKSGTLVSSVSGLRPYGVWDTSTGEDASSSFMEDASFILSYVQKDVQKLFAVRTEDVLRDADGLKGNANGYARTLGYASSYKSLPRTVKAASRINEIVLHKLFSEVASYVRNPNPRKQLPTFGKKISLGAVDKQMASLSIDPEAQTLSLLWKCWEHEYLLEFRIPDYVLNKNISKFSLPTVRDTHNGIVFDFSVQEHVPGINKNSTLRAGMDLGRVEPYVVAVVNQDGNRVAHYGASGRLKQLNAKRERILAHAADLRTKIAAYEALGIPTEKIEVLKEERRRLRNKASRLVKPVAQQAASEIASKLHKHSLSALRVEDLSWAHGAKYGSKWAHSITQVAAEHAVRRNGTKIDRVSPRGTSQHCHQCGAAIAHDSSRRTVRCDDCRTQLDRDFNAAMNLAKKQSYPVRTSRTAGNNSSASDDAAGCQPSGCGSVLKLDQQLQP